jgi:hypothetical protein
VSESLLYFNGVNALTGDYARAPASVQGWSAQTLSVPSTTLLADLEKRKEQTEQSDGKLAAARKHYAELQADLATLLRMGSADVNQLQSLRRQIADAERFLVRNTHAGVRQGIDPLSLSQAGWGIIFPARIAADRQSQILEALRPLLSRRKMQAGDRFRTYVGAGGYRTGDTKARFLSRHGAAPAGPASPEAVPYYLLLIGSPEEIPFEFQYHLDIQYAVGRLHFLDVAGYHNYAKSVVQTEEKGSPKAQKLTLCGVQNPSDPATEKTERFLTKPLSDEFGQTAHGWQIEKLAAEQTSQKGILAQLGGSQTASLLFVACHGIEYPTGHPLQRARQGALLDNRWCRSENRPLSEDDFVAAHHLSSSADVSGMMLFAFACYSAGAPLPAEYPSPDGVVPATAADVPFVGSLPMELLSHPRGGALAVIGHVERAWGFAYGVDDARQRSHTAVFHSALSRLLLGHPVGHAMEFFNEHYAERATALSELVFQILNHRTYDPQILGELWCESADARGYVVLGDPAVRFVYPSPSLAEAVPQVAEAVPQVTDIRDEQTAFPCPQGISPADWERTPRAVKEWAARLQKQSAETPVR